MGGGGSVGRHRQDAVEAIAVARPPAGHGIESAAADVPCRAFDRLTVSYKELDGPMHMRAGPFAPLAGKRRGHFAQSR